MSLDLTDDKSTLVQVMAWCHRATSHYLSQCWPRSVSPCGVSRPQWVNSLVIHYLVLAGELTGGSKENKQYNIINCSDSSQGTYIAIVQELWYWNAYCTTGALGWEPPGFGGFPLQRDSNVGLWGFLCCFPEQSVEQTVKLQLRWDAMWCHYNGHTMWQNPLRTHQASIPTVAPATNEVTVACPRNDYMFYHYFCLEFFGMNANTPLRKQYICECIRWFIISK